MWSYTGNRKTRPESISLAGEFFPGEECCLDVKIRMIYDGKKGYACKKRKEAAIKKTIEDSKYFGATKQDTVLRLREKFNIPQNEADEMIKEYW